MNTREKIEVMQAYINGGKIEISEKYKENWIDLGFIDPIWDWKNCKYRIKPKSTYIPFTFEDRKILILTVIEHKITKFLHVITSVDDTGIMSAGNHITFEILLEKYNFINGTPCGKLQQNN